MTRPPRILLVARELTPSPRDGGQLRRGHLLRVLRDLGPTAAFALAPGPPASPGLAGWHTAADPDAARTPQGPAILDALRAGRSPLGAVDSPSTVEELGAVVADFAPDVVVVSGVELFGYVDVLRPVAPRLVLDLDYAQAAGLGGMARADPNRSRSLLWRHVLTRVADEERAVLARVDDVWVSNWDECARVRATADVAVVPNVVDVDSYARAPRSDPGALVYTGRFDFWPNEEAARVLVEQVVPALDGASLTLVGLAPPAWLTSLADPRVTVTGPVPDVRPYFQDAAIMPIPLPAGAGTRLKVLEAFASGLPVVSTAKGVEGLGLSEGLHYARAESPADFIAAIDRVRGDRTVAEAMIDASTELVNRSFSLAALRQAVSTALGA